MSTMDNCLVVLNYNDAQTTYKFVEMASKCTTINKIIVVDNYSSDNSFEELLKLSNDEIDVIQSERNGGYAYGNNFGCRYAIENYNPECIFISNPDVCFSDETIKHMQDALCKNENIGVIAPIVNQGYNVWTIPTFLGVLESIFMIWHNIHKRSIKKRLLDDEREIVNIGVVEGSFWCVKKDAYIKAGGLDEKTFLYYEENIFSKRLNNCGFTEAVLTKDRYDHFHSVSIKKRFGGKTRAFKHFHTGMLIYLNKYLSSNFIKRGIFEICFLLGYLERIIFDIVNPIIGKIRGK